MKKILLFKSVALGFIFLSAGLAHSEEYPEKIETVSGNFFVRVQTRPEFDPAYRLPNGVVWTNVIQKNGSPAKLTQQEAAQYCASFGATLPSEKDFNDFFSFSITSSGYTPIAKDNLTDILPNIGVAWTSNLYPQKRTMIPDASVIGLASANLHHFSIDDESYARCIYKK